MAEKEIGIKINVEADTGAKSLSELKKEFKETQKTLEGLDTSSKDYIATLQKLGKIKDDIGDLNAEIKAFNPEGKVQAFGNVIGGLASGFQAAQGAAALFGQEGEALQKTLLKVQAASALADGIKGVVAMGDAFKVLGNIVKANPIFLIVTVVTAIGAALYALKDKVSFIGDAFEAVGEVIGYLIDKGKEFLDWIGVTSFALDDMRKSVIDNNKKIQKSNSERYDSEIAEAKRAGKETEILEIKKLQDFTKTNDGIIQQLRLRKKESGSLSDEDQKQLDELVGANRKAYTDIRNLADTYQDNRLAKVKKINEEIEGEHKLHAQHLKDIQALLDASWIEAHEKAITDSFDAEQKASQDNIDDLNEMADEEAENDMSRTQTVFDFKMRMTAEEFNQRLALTQQSIQATQSLTDLAFAYQLKQAHGNAKKEREIKRRQFRINKAFSVAQIILNTIMGITQAISSSPPPLSWVLAGVNSAMGTAATIKAISTKFDGGDDGGGVGGAVGGLGSLGAASGGVALAPPSSGSTQLNPDGTVKNANLNKPPVVKAIVTETDITTSQKRVNKIEERSKL